MKKSIRIIAIAMVALMLCLCLASCGKKLSGKYRLDATVVGSGAVTTYEFSGSKVTLTVEAKALGNVVGDPVVLEGKYSIKDDKITFEFEGEEENTKEYNTTADFAETEEGIKIGVLEFKKVD